MRALVYAHFSRRNSLAEYVLHATECYRRYIEKIIFVSASPLPHAAWEKLNNHCAAVIERQNTGYDFASWKEGIRTLGSAEQFEQIILANDSVIGPLGDPSEMFDRLFSDRRDVCGLTLSWEESRHIQSYFIRYGRDVLASGAFETFWRTVEPLENKKDIIARYEIGLADFMEDRGHTTGALLEPPTHFSKGKRLAIWARSASIRAPRLAYERLTDVWDTRYFNPTHYFWREMLNAGIPYLKKDLIRDNPTLEFLDNIFQEAARRYGIDAASLERFARA